MTTQSQRADEGKAAARAAATAAIGATQEPRRPFGEWVYDYATAAWWWSDEMFRLYGLQQQNPVPLDLVFEGVPADEREAIANRLAAALAHGGPVSGQHRFTPKGGSERAVAFVGDAEVDEAGRVGRLRGYAFDVTHEVRSAATAAVLAATKNRKVIEQVKGALMLAYHVDEVVAFEILSRYSQVNNIKLALLAQRVAAHMAEVELDGIQPEKSLLQLLDRSAHE